MSELKAQLAAALVELTTDWPNVIEAIAHVERALEIAREDDFEFPEASVYLGPTAE